MSNKAFSLKNILCGILLGLTIVAGWLFYPNILNFFKSSALQTAKKTTTVFRDNIDNVSIPFSSEKDELSAPKFPTKDDEEIGTPGLSELKGDDGIYSSLQETRHEAVVEVIQKPFKKKIIYAFWEFDKQMIAEEFMESVRKRSGVDLWLGQEGHRYIVYIPAVDEQGMREKAELIKSETGIAGK